MELEKMVETNKSNPIAELRRLRKLENQRLEAEARQRQEELKQRHEQELQRQENERIAAEQRRLSDLEQIRRQREAEEERIAKLERTERDVILGIEHKLRLIGAFCTGEIRLANSTGVPRCSGILLALSLDRPIPAMTEDVIFVGDDSSRDIEVFAQQTRRHLFTLTTMTLTGAPTAMCITRTGHLVVCFHKANQLVVYDLATIFSANHTASLSHRSSPPVIPLDSAIAATCGGPRGSNKGEFSCPRGICVDDLASELFVSDQLNHRIQVFKMDFFVSRSTKVPPVSFQRCFGIKGHGRGHLHNPSGLDVSHYHVLVCDTGNSRVVAFAKRGAFVCVFGSKGHNDGQFVEVRDIKLANVRKRALARGLPVEENTITNEQFEMLVADSGNFRVQVLNERGEFLRTLSLLAGPEQIAFNRDLLAAIQANLLHSYAALKLPVPSLRGSDLSSVYPMAKSIHPFCPSYAFITQQIAAYRADVKRFHHPFALSYGSSEKELYVVDRENATLYVYNADGSRSSWISLPDEPADHGLTSCHSCVYVSNDTENFLYVSDPQSHRIVVLRMPGADFVRYIGATTYGDQNLCSYGYLPGELRFPTYLALWTQPTSPPQLMLLISETGNHFVSLFDAVSGEFSHRIGSGSGHQEGYFDSPQGLAVYEDRLLYIADQNNHRVQIYSLQDGQFVKSIGREGTEPGKFSFPTAIAVCSALHTMPKCNFGSHRQAKLLVGDAGNRRIQAFDLLKETVLYVIDTSHTPFERPLLPSSIFVEPRSAYFLVTDMENLSVAIFRQDGSFVTAFGANVEPENRFHRPVSIILAPHFDRGRQVLILDSLRKAVCTYALSN
ncbi:hypothetical protein Poli38472_006077 [Pythium oligandrum]|uniref:NHL repeat protein n=1 Tax=Pythium oligandrum TaxID=41045 RepID=A0A8K1FPQ5_PYTOL|nr:hypothetical protein Poli38472_006077 [Pythium oligandrum]|eukprot:TMW68609.1 hypothetical protein Poli38472_006077 [Pythium oligandrum]